jgi:acetyltransferase-like isoleucine patch superfamily enzyme
MTETDAVVPPFAPAKGRSLSALLQRARAEPRRGFLYALALLKGQLYKLYYPLRGIRFRAGRHFLVYGSLSICGPGEVIFGDRVAIWGKVTPWTYSREARILVGDNTMMSGTRFACIQEIRVGRNSILADARIMDTDFHSTRADRRSESAPIRIAAVEVGENVWVAAQAALLPGTRIGRNSVVSFGAVCMREYPEDKVIMGNPARVAMPIPTSDDPMDRAPPPGA